MKKLYALLLLGSLLLLGTNSAWATNYYVGHNGYLEGAASEWGSWQKSANQMIAVENGWYRLLFPNVTTGQDIKFKIVADDSWWDANSNWYSYTGDYEGITTDLEFSLDGTALKINSDKPIVDVYFNPTGWKIYVKTSNTTHSVSIASENSAHLYMYDKCGNKYNGTWGSETDGTNDNKNWTITGIPEGISMYVILRNSDRTNQTPDILLGEISSNKSYSFNLDFSSFNSLKGDFNGWTDEHIFPSTDQVSVKLKAGVEYNYQITNVYRNSEDSYKTYWTWYGLGDAVTMLPNTAHEVSWYFNGDKNCGILTTVEGDYTFALSSWSEGKPSVTVTYPTTYERDLAIGAYGTICLPVEATVSGATLYTIKEISGGKLVITEAGTSLTKGTPYIYKATAATQTFTLNNSSYDGTAAAAVNGLVGKYADFPFAGSGLSLVYVVLNNSIAPASEESGVKGNRAFIKLDQVPGYSASAPSAIRITEEENNATNINAIDANEEVVKFFQNGKLFIQKNGVVYDMMGTIVK